MAIFVEKANVLVVGNVSIPSNDAQAASATNHKPRHPELVEESDTLRN
jgi:hypothetical protein